MKKIVALVLVISLVLILCYFWTKNKKEENMINKIPNTIFVGAPYLEITYSTSTPNGPEEITYSEVLKFKSEKTPFTISFWLPGRTGAPTTNIELNPDGTSTVAQDYAFVSRRAVKDKIIGISYLYKNDTGDESGLVNISYLDDGDKFIRNYEAIGKITRENWVALSKLVNPYIYTNMLKGIEEN